MGFSPAAPSPLWLLQHNCVTGYGYNNKKTVHHCLREKNKIKTKLISSPKSQKLSNSHSNTAGV